MMPVELPPPAPPEYRQDPISGQWTIIASERAARPIDSGVENSTADQAPASDCPFCPGNEAKTPPALGTFPADAPPGGWQIRVVPNCYPAVRVDDVAGSKAVAANESSHFQVSRLGYGRHEVIVERPEHKATLGDLPVGAWLNLLLCYRNRVRVLCADDRIEYVSVFKNCGPTAGASQFHAHSQVIGTTRTPPWVALEYERLAAAFRRTGEYLLDRMIMSELSAERRVIASDGAAVALCPFASRFPLETWIVPRRGGRFADAEDTELLAVAALLKRVVAAVEVLVPNAAYNYYLHDVPARLSADGYRWHFEIAARVIGIAGFELAGGMFLNPFPPEWSAQRIRDAVQTPATATSASR